MKNRHMPKAAISVAAALTLVAASCGEALRDLGRDLETPRAVPPELLSGKWVRYRTFDVEALAESNVGRYGGWSAGGKDPRATGFDLLPGGIGYELIGYWLLDQGRPGPITARAPENARAIDGDQHLVWTWHNESRWSVQGDVLLIQTTINTHWEIMASPEQPDVLAANYSGITEWWFRIGSPVHQRVAEFQLCVDANKGRKLFEVERCDSPFTP